MKKYWKRALIFALPCIYVFLSKDLFSDSVWYKDGTVLSGKITGQDCDFIFLEVQNGDLLRIGKDALFKITYQPPEMNVSIKVDHQKSSEVLHLSTNTQPSETSPTSPSSSEPVLKENMYYLILKDEKSYLIRINGLNFQSIQKIFLDNSKSKKSQEFHNVKSKSLEMIVDSNGLDPGFYDLVLESKTGKSVKREYFIEVKEP